MKTAMARILVPPGIGDGYWVLCKLRGFMERHRIQSAKVYVHDAGPRRSDGMWKRVPFVEWGGYAPIPSRGSAVRTVLNRAYRHPGFSVQRRVFGFDFFISLNGSLDHGWPMDRAMPGSTNWYEPLTGMDVTEGYASMFRRRFGDYIAVGVWDHGFYRHWMAQFPEPRLVETLRRMADTHTVVLMGAAFDKGGLAERMAGKDERFVNLVGGTDFDELTGLLSGASAVFGFPAGNTMLGPRFYTPTVLMWTDHFPKGFWYNSCPPVPSLYAAVDAKGVTPDALVEHIRLFAAQAAA